jgi:broad specificity phosphatase PhoE
MQLFLVRHGQSLYNMEQRHQGWLDIALSPLGEQQAGRIAERLKQQPFDYIFSSPIKRCYDTCAAIVQAQGRPLSDIQVLQDLKEARLSAALEGKLEKEIFKSWPKEQREAFRDDYNFKLEDGESVKEVIERTITAYKYIASLSEAAPPDPEEELNEETAAASKEPEPKQEKTPQPKPKPKTALIVAHRIQVQLLTLLTLDAVEILAREQTLIDRVEISNCSLTVLNVNVKGKRPLYQLLTMNDINHLAGLSAPPPPPTEASTIIK